MPSVARPRTCCPEAQSPAPRLSPCPLQTPGAELQDPTFAQGPVRPPDPGPTASRTWQSPVHRLLNPAANSSTEPCHHRLAPKPARGAGTEDNTQEPSHPLTAAFAAPISPHRCARRSSMAADAPGRFLRVNSRSAQAAVLSVRSLVKSGSHPSEVGTNYYPISRRRN